MRTVLLTSISIIALSLSVFCLPASAAEPANSQTSQAAGKPLVTISKETTHILEPLRSDGYPDYLAAINKDASKDITSQNNAVVVFWRAFGPRSIDKEDRDKFWQLLGIEPLPEKGDYFEDIEVYAERHPKLWPPGARGNFVELEKPFDARTYATKQAETASKRPWSKQEFPLVAAWLTANEKPLLSIIDGTRRSRYFEPFVMSKDQLMLDVHLPGTEKAREIAQLLVIRAMLRLNQKKLSDACDDLTTCHSLANLIGQGPCLVHGLSAMNVHSMAFEAEHVLLPHLDTTQLADLQKALASSVVCPDVASKIDLCERYMVLDAICRAARTGRPVRTIREVAANILASLEPDSPETKKEMDFLEGLSDVLSALRMDWDIQLRMANERFDTLTTALRIKDPAERKAALSKFDDEIKELHRRMKENLSKINFSSSQEQVSESMGSIWVNMMMDAFTLSGRMSDRFQMRRELTNLGFAISLYKVEHGRYPASLEDLRPRYLDEVPTDSFSAATLHYSTDGNGFLVYSVGLNGRNDHGNGYAEAEQEQLKRTPEKEPDWDDLTLRVPADAQN